MRIKIIVLKFSVIKNSTDSFQLFIKENYNKLNSSENSFFNLNETFLKS